MRGKRKPHVRRCRGCRITPAGAGKTRQLRLCMPLHQDHPRRCGENIDPRTLTFNTRGSPPQVRGKRSIQRAGRVLLRITPAGAGKTSRRRGELQVSKDHPRRCGENLLEKQNLDYNQGSPPQVRGKHLRDGGPVSVHWITPAGAGKTLKRSFRNQPFCSRAVQISFNFSNSLNVSLQSGSAR